MYYISPIAQGVFHLESADSELNELHLYLGSFGHFTMKISPISTSNRTLFRKSWLVTWLVTCLAGNAGFGRWVGELPTSPHWASLPMAAVP